VKQAYHRTLLRSHPDKQIAIEAEKDVDISIIREAYLTLSDPEAKRIYDASLKSRTDVGPRPAQIVSLDNFEVRECRDGEDGGDIFSYTCRCGGQYRITEQQLERDIHLIGCEACSEVIWAGYEAAEED
ncbi:hypothetical protein M422DRAFT_102915, partial [Sphaerobolus stellatus SS14]